MEMDIEVKIIGREDAPDNDRRSVVVETHHKRGESYVVARADSVIENGEGRFRLPPGGRLIVTTPEGDDEIVYDAAQGAAVRRSAQRDPESGKADSALEPIEDPADTRPMGSGVRPGATVTPNQPPNTASGSIAAKLGPGEEKTPLVQAQPHPSAPQMRANSTPSRAPTPAETPEQKAKRETEERAKAQQQTMQGRPPGETPPKPGSPVGSPPSGNEGKDK
jgi:hypothetical protein